MTLRRVCVCAYIHRSHTGRAEGNMLEELNSQMIMFDFFFTVFIIIMLNSCMYLCIFHAKRSHLDAV